MQAGKQTRKSSAAKQLPTRNSPRIGIEGYARYGKGKQNPIQSGIILNVSEGGVQLFADAPLAPNTPIQIELGVPIFTVPRMVSGRVRHTQPASETLMQLLRQRGKIRPLTKGYLLGVEFTQLDDELRHLLHTFVKEHTHEEQQRRSQAQDYMRNRTARDRTVVVVQHYVPRWVYAAALLSGAYMIAVGIWQDRDSLTVALSTAMVLLGLWVSGRIGIALWNWLGQQSEYAATTVATMDGETTADDATRTDADSQLDLPLASGKVDTSGTETPNGPVSTAANIEATARVA